MKLSKISSTKKVSQTGTVADQLANEYRVVNTPSKGLWEEVEPGLRFMETYEMDEDHDNDERSKKEDKPPSKTVVTMVFETNMHGGKERVEKFIEKAMAWYTNEVAKLEDHSRFMYQPLVRDRAATAEQRKKPRLYKRYELSADKTFKSLFFPEKERLLRILHHFERKTGKYAVKGFPHKLGLLLHGPPGTGKTSLVKAIAQHTNRSIVAVPLSRISTNQELMDVMFDQRFDYKAPKSSADDEDDGSTPANRLLYSEVIFLLEDVDAASSVVHNRTTGKQSTMARQLSHAAEKQYSEPERPIDSLPIPHLDQLMLWQTLATEKAKDSKAEKAESSWFLSDKDKLTLSGLLTVLDGVVDAPGRILIMTTNHPEKLDPALTRPGRINMQIYMGFIKTREALQMVVHYYGAEATPDRLERVQLVFDAMHRRHHI
jgi:hypothetical protein